MHLAFAFDQNFVIPAHVMLTSIFQKTVNKHIVFHVIATGVTVEEKGKLEDYVKQNKCRIVFYEIDKRKLQDFIIPPGTHFSLANYYRLFFPELVPDEVSKLLYLDTDIVVIEDLSSLYETNLAGLPVGAVSDPKIRLRPDLGITEEGNYFNSGVLLIDVFEWKRRETSKKAIQFINENPGCIQWVDQDALNAVLHNNWYKLEKKYNVTFYDIPEYLPKRKFLSFTKGKAIIHFTTQNKPWLLTCTNRLKFLYHHYLAQTPYVSHEKYSDEHLKSKYLFRLFRLRTKEALTDIGLLQKLRHIKAIFTN